MLKFSKWLKREEIFDDKIPNLTKPKKQRQTPAQKHEMEKAIRAAKSPKLKKQIRYDYEYGWNSGNAETIDTTPTTSTE